MKTWGPFKESNGNELTNFTIAQIVGDPRITTMQGFALNPLRQPNSALDAISGKDVQMLEYVCTIVKREPGVSDWAKFVDHIISRVISNYGFSIGCHSIRFGLLAYSAAHQFSRGLYGNEDRIDEYSTPGYHALRMKECSQFGEEELLTMFFLLMTEEQRYWGHVGTSHSNSGRSRARRRMTVHLWGIKTLLEHFGDRIRAAITERFGDEVWELVVDMFGSSIGYIDGPDVIAMASFYRKCVADIQNSRQFLSPAQREIAIGNIAAGLMKISLQECIKEASEVRASLEDELELHLSLWENDTFPQSPMTHEGRSNWKNEQYAIMQRNAGKIALHIFKEQANSFSWSQELVSTALSVYEWAKYNINRNQHQNAAVIYVLKAALVIPPADSLHCRLPLS